MKTCMVWGDMTADSAADQYPLVTVCDECVKSIAGKEDSPIVAIEGGYDYAHGEECHFCDKTKEEEDDGE